MLEKYNQLKSKGKNIIFCWIPSHIGIKGNEEADEAAKEALLLNEALKTIVALDLGNKINNLLQEVWQREWESEPNMNNKLKRVLPKLNENHTPKRYDQTRWYSVCKASHRPVVFDSLLSPKRRTPAFLRHLQRSTDNKPLTNKLC